VLVAPWSSTPGDRPAPQPAVVSLPAYEVAAARASIPAAAPAAPVQAVASRVAPVTVPAAPAVPARRGVLGGTGLSDKCVVNSDETAVERSGAGVSLGSGGTGCEPEENPVLHVGPELPDNQTGVNQVGIESSIIDCETLGSLPATECTSDGAKR
jgi:hypothetical protein